MIIPPCFLVLPKQSPHRTHCFALCSCPIFHQNVPLIPKFPFFQALSTIHEYFYYIFAVKKYVCCNAPLESRIFLCQKMKKNRQNILIKKKLDGGFINPTYEKVNKILGYVAIVAVIILFIVLLWYAFTSGSAD